MMDQGRVRLDEKMEILNGAMHNELKANEKKGDWAGEDAQQHVHELLYHAAKLSLAVRFSSKHAVLEYCADVANHALMVIDLVGAWDATLDLTPVEYGEEGEPWVKGLKDLKALVETFSTEVQCLDIPTKWPEKELER